MFCVPHRQLTRRSGRQDQRYDLLMNSESNTTKRKEVRAAARVLDDGTLIELIFDPETKHTNFAICRDGEISVEEYIDDVGERIVPFSPENNLIKHEAVLLPSRPEPIESVESLREHLQSFIHRYVDLSPVFEQITVQYILLSWVYDAFNELPYLRLQGDYGTGKTRALLVLGALAYRPFFASGASTVSPIFHTLNAFRGTLIFDEADFRMSDEKAELVKILNNGTVRGMPVLRTLMNQKKEFDPAAFQVFGPKIVATRGTYDDKALESRFLTELMGGRKLREDIPINLPTTFKAEALHLRNQLLSYRLTQFHSIRLNPELVDLSLEPRQNQILIPLLSVTNDAELRAAIRENVRVGGQGLLAERSVSIEGELLAVVLRLFATDDRSPIPMKFVRDEFIAAHGSEFERPITTRYLTMILRRRLSIRIMKTMGVMAIPYNEKERVREIGKRFGLDNTHGVLSREIGRKGDVEAMLIHLSPSGGDTAPS
jgi:hypothetical protein